MKATTGWMLITILALCASSVLAQQDRPRRPGGPGGPPDRPGQPGARGDRGDRPGPGGPGRGDFRPPPHPLQTALDADNDGTISAAEIDNAVAALRKLDKNNDGMISPEEMRPEGMGRGPGGPGFPGRGGPGGPDGNFAQRIMSSDANGDGKVTKDELPERMQQMFDRLDANQDGAIDKAEAEAASQRFNRGGPRGPGDPGDRLDRPRGNRPGGDADGDRPARPRRPD